MDLKLAVKNILRNRARTLITLAAVGFGCVSLILTGGLMADLLFQLRESIIRSSLGHLQIHRKGYSEKGLLRPYDFMIADPEAVIRLVSGVPGVRRVTPRVRFSGLLSTGETTLSFFGEGVDPAREGEISTGLAVLSGEGLAAGDLFSAVIGAGLAKAVAAKPGDPLVLVTNTKEGAINALDVAVKGTFTTGSQDLDSQVLRVPIATAQRLLHTSAVHSIVVLLDRTEDTDRVRGELERLLGEKGLDLEIRPWREMADFYTKAEVFLDRQFLILKAIIAVVVVLSVFNTMNMSVIERIGEIGTVMALGYKRSGVVRLFMAEGLALGVLGALVGLTAGFVIAHAISWVGIPLPPPPGRSLGATARVMIVPAVFAQAFVLAVAATLVSSVYPAFKASRLEIAEALRQNI